VSPNLVELLRRLQAGGVDFVLVGGLAAVAQGAPVTTFDVEIVHDRAPENVDRLLTVLSDLKAVVRAPGQRRLPPQREALLGAGHSLFTTELGPLDCLGSIEDGMTYESARQRAAVVSFAGRPLAVLELSALVELKEKWPDAESKLRASVLRQTLARRAR